MIGVGWAILGRVLGRVLGRLLALRLPHWGGLAKLGMLGGGALRLIIRLAWSHRVHRSGAFSSHGCYLAGFFWECLRWRRQVRQLSNDALAKVIIGYVHV